MGPVASQEAIKQLGTNGGGFFNANSAHPFENPTPWSNFWSDVRDLPDPGGPRLHVRPDGEERSGTAGPCGRRCSCCSSRGVTTAYWAEARGNPIHAARGIDVAATRDESRRQHGGEGGAVRHRQLRALRHGHDRRVVRRGQRDARLVHADRRPRAARQHPARRSRVRRRRRGPLRHARRWSCSRSSSPVSWSDARRSISARRSRRAKSRWRCCTCSSSPLVVLTIDGRVASLDGRGLAGLNNAGPHGLSEILYAFTSTAGNNGSAFAGLTGTTYYYNTLLGAHDAHRAVRDDGADARARRIPRREEDRAGDGGHLPGDDAAVRRAPRRRHPDRRRAHVLPGALARSDRRAPAR